VITFVKDKFVRFTGGLWRESTAEFKSSFGPSSMCGLPNTVVQWTPDECHLQCSHKRFPRKRRRWFSHARGSSNNSSVRLYIINFISHNVFKLLLSIVIHRIFSQSFLNQF